MNTMTIHRYDHLLFAALSCIAAPTAAAQEAARHRFGLAQPQPGGRH